MKEVSTMVQKNNGNLLVLIICHIFILQGNPLPSRGECPEDLDKVIAVLLKALNKTRNSPCKIPTQTAN
jgi:hypothetical protein